MAPAIILSIDSTRTTDILTNDLAQIAPVIVTSLGPKGATTATLVDSLFLDGAPSPAMLTWLQETLKGELSWRSLDVAAVEAGKATTTTLSRCFVTGMALPALDAASKSAAALAVSARPATIATSAAAAFKAPAGLAHRRSLWRACDFRFHFAYIEARIIRVSSIGFTRGFTTATSGRGATAARPALGDFEVVMTRASSNEFIKWSNKFLKEPEKEHELSAECEYLWPDHKSPIVTASLSGVTLLTVSASGDEVTARFAYEGLEIA